MGNSIQMVEEDGKVLLDYNYYDDEAFEPILTKAREAKLHCLAFADQYIDTFFNENQMREIKEKEIPFLRRELTKFPDSLEALTVMEVCIDDCLKKGPLLVMRLSAD